MSSLRIANPLCLSHFLSKESLIFQVFKANDKIYNFNFNLISDLDSLCPICLKRCIKPCKPDSCPHKFCIACLRKWKKYKAICPYCRKTFKKLILIK